MAMLEIRDLEVNYGAINAIKNIFLMSIRVKLSLWIGANGAGKTTTLHTITGLLKAKSGSVRFEGKGIDQAAAAQDCGDGHGARTGGQTHFPAAFCV